jgi:hypothetical protein
MTTRNVSRHCQLSTVGQNHPDLGISDLQDVGPIGEFLNVFLVLFVVLRTEHRASGLLSMLSITELRLSLYKRSSRQK